MVRTAKLEDWPEVEKLFRAMVTELGGLYDCQPGMALGLLKARLEEGDPVFVWDQEGRPAAAAFWVESPASEVRTVLGLGTYVLPELRRRGIAEVLREAALDAYRKRGCVRAAGQINLQNKASLALAEKEGWKAVATVFEREL